MKKLINIVLASALTISVHAQIDRSKAPIGAPAKEINIAKSETFTLANGLTVIVVENNKLPKVQGNLFFNHPPVAFGPKAGIKDIIGTMVMAGTKTKDKETLDEEIEFMGSSISVSSNSVNFSTLKKNLNKTFELFADVTLNPAFNNSSELEKTKKQIKTAIESAEKNPDEISNRVTNVLLFGANHPYGEYTTEEKIDGISMEDLVNYYHTYFIPNNAILTLTGDIKKADAEALVNKYFANWKVSATTPAHVKYTLPQAKSTRIVLVDLPVSTQSVINIINTNSLKKANADYFASYVGNAILGTGMASRLFKNIREDKGWTYGAYSSLSDDFYLNGVFSASAKVRNNVTDSAVVEFLKELNSIRSAQVTEDELKLNKAQITGMFALGLERPETIARFARNIKIEGLPADFYNNFLKNINSVTPSAIQDAMKKYIAYDNLTILIVGKVEEILVPLQNLGYPIEFVDKFGNPIADPTAKKSAGDITGIQIINKYIDAIGGVKTLKKVKSIADNYEVSISGVPMSLEGTSKKMAPNKSDFRIITSGMTIMRQAFDGENGFSEQMGSRVPYDADQIKEAKSATLFSHLNLKAEQLTVDGIVTINGKEAYKVIVTKNEESSIEYFDVETGFLVKSESTRENKESGEKMSVINEFSDYKDYNGIKMPSKLSITAGEQTINMTVTNRQINKGVKASDFF